MRRADLVDLFVLAALWGASFLFMRVAVPQFGPLAMAGVRVAGASLLLLALLGWRGELGLLRQHAKPLFIVGVTNSALPFALFGYAALHLSAGLSAIFNASTPLFGALIAWAWLHDRLTPWRVAGLGIGFIGVAGLAWSKAGSVHGGPAWAVAACLAAPVLYGFSASFTKRHLAGVPALAQATGSQVFATVALAVPAALAWPATPPDAQAWLMLALLAVLCTGLAYVLYFRLIRNVGPARAIAVTFLIPAFAVLWGALFLGESITLPMLLGCVVILVGTALATGLLPRPPAAPHRAGS
jgi:drug/metabolite transporter (DMT)-like permease